MNTRAYQNYSGTLSIMFFLWKCGLSAQVETTFFLTKMISCSYRAKALKQTKEKSTSFNANVCLRFEKYQTREDLEYLLHDLLSSQNICKGSSIAVYIYFHDFPRILGLQIPFDVTVVSSDPEPFTIWFCIPFTQCFY